MKTRLCKRFQLEHFDLKQVLCKFHTQLLASRSPEYFSAFATSAKEHSKWVDDGLTPFVLQGGMTKAFEEFKPLYPQFDKLCDPTDLIESYFSDTPVQDNVFFKHAPHDFLHPMECCRILTNAQAYLSTQRSIDSLKLNALTDDSLVRGCLFLCDDEASSDITKLVEVVFDKLPAILAPILTLEEFQRAILKLIRSELESMSYFPDAHIINMLSQLGVFVFDYDGHEGNLISYFSKGSMLPKIQEPGTIVLAYHSQDLQMCQVTGSIIPISAKPKISPFIVELHLQLFSNHATTLELIMLVWASIRELRLTHPNDPLGYAMDILLQHYFSQIIPGFDVVVSSLPESQCIDLAHPQARPLDTLLVDLFFTPKSSDHCRYYDSTLFLLSVVTQKMPALSDQYIMGLDEIISSPNLTASIIDQRYLTLYAVVKATQNPLLHLRLLIDVTTFSRSPDVIIREEILEHVLNHFILNFQELFGLHRTIHGFRANHPQFVTTFNKYPDLLVSLSGLIKAPEVKQTFASILDLFPKTRVVLFERRHQLGVVQEHFVKADGDCFFTALKEMITLKDASDRPACLNEFSDAVQLRRFVATFAQNTVSSLRQVGREDWVDMLQAMLTSVGIDAEIRDALQVVLVHILNERVRHPAVAISEAIAELIQNPATQSPLHALLQDAYIADISLTYQTFRPLVTSKAREFFGNSSEIQILLDTQNQALLTQFVAQIFSDFTGPHSVDSGYDYTALMAAILRRLQAGYQRSETEIATLLTSQEVFAILNDNLHSKWAAQPEIAFLSCVIPLEASPLGEPVDGTHVVNFGQTMAFKSNDIPAAQAAFNDPKLIHVLVRGNHYYGLSHGPQSYPSAKRKSGEDGEGKKITTHVHFLIILGDFGILASL